MMRSNIGGGVEGRYDSLVFFKASLSEWLALNCKRFVKVTLLILFNLTCFGHPLAIFNRLVVAQSLSQKSRIQEAPTLMTNVDSNNNTIIF